MVRSSRDRKRLPRAARWLRLHGGDESADLGQGCCRNRTGWLPVLRFNAANATVEVSRRHQRHRYSAHRDCKRRLHRSAPAPAIQKYYLRRCAVGVARCGSGGDRTTHCRAIQGQGKVAAAEYRRFAHGPRLCVDTSRLQHRSESEAGG